MSEIDDAFERELSTRLRRGVAPASLASGVMDRIAGEPRRTLTFPPRHVWIGRVAALFLLTALLFGGGIESLYHRRATQRARAEHDFARSQELTSRALEPVRRHLRRAGVSLDE